MTITMTIITKTTRANSHMLELSYVNDNSTSPHAFSLLN